MRARTLLRAAAALAAVLACGLAAPAPASAHSGMTPDSRFYRSAIGSVSPQVPGLTVSLDTTGETITVRNDTGKLLEVRGYTGEEYLRISASGVEENAASLSAFLNGTNVLNGLPQGQAPAQQAAPEWKHISDSTTYSWHDHRTHWMSQQRPPAVAADPDHPHPIFDWKIAMTLDGQPVTVTGRLTWVGGSRLPGWRMPLFVVGGVALALTAVLVAVRARPRRDGGPDGGPDAGPDTGPDAAGGPTDGTGHRIDAGDGPGSAGSRADDARRATTSS